jgi:hypothetical protein
MARLEKELEMFSQVNSNDLNEWCFNVGRFDFL